MPQYITVDGDNIGQRIASCYLRNDADALIEINSLVDSKTAAIAAFLKSLGFQILFRAADGVAAFATSSLATDDKIFSGISNIGGGSLSFSAGVGCTLREAYVALLSAKSSGKACLHNYKSIEDVQDR